MVCLVIILDLIDKTVRRQRFYRELYFVPGNVNWISPTSMWITQWELPDMHLLYDVEADGLQHLTEEYGLVFDSSGKKYASLFGKAIWFYGRRAARHVVKEHLVVSEALRYNSYWVYPKPLEGFVTPEEYTKWRRDISVREYGKGPEEPPIIRTRGVALDKNHVLAMPVFVDKTTWVGFFEQVYPLGRFDGIVESNIVLLDAHAVTTNPPRPEDIQVKKRPFPSLMPLTEGDYIFRAMGLVSRWNAATGRLELWQSKGWRQVIFEERKLGETPIDLATMEIGAYVPVEGKWIKLTK